MNADQQGSDDGVSTAESGPLGPQLRAEAGALAIGAPPVDAVVRRGRALRRRRRAVVAGVAVAAVALPVGVALLPQPGGGETAPPAASSDGNGPAGGAEGPSPEDAGDAGPGSAEVVGPRVAVDIGEGMRLGLIPGDEPRYAVAPEAEFPAALEQAEESGRDPELPTGPELESVPVPGGGLAVIGVVTDPGETGRIELTADGESRPVRLLELAEENGWAVYAAVLNEPPRDGTLRVTQWDGQGTVLSDTAHGIAPED